MHCPALEKTDAFKEACSKLDDSSEFVEIGGEYKNYYLEKTVSGDINTYYVIDVSAHYSSQGSGICSECRKDEKFRAGCVQSDLCAASDIMSGRALQLTKYSRHKIEGINSEKYSYTCTKNNDRELIELAFPIYIDSRCVAVLIAGQIDSEKLKSEGMTIESAIENSDEIKDVAKNAEEFSKRMQERTDMRRTDFYFRRLSTLCDDITKQQKRQNSSEIIKNIYEKIANNFDCKELAVFYSDSTNPLKYSCISFTNHEDYSGLSAKLLKAVYADSDRGLRELFSADGDDYVGLYRQHSHTNANGSDGVDCFILTFVRWKSKTSNNVSFFLDALNARLFSILITDVALEKQREAEEKKTAQEILVETFTHDINQKLEIVMAHKQILEGNKIVWKLPNDSRVFDDITDYQKDVDNLIMQLRHFAKEVRDNDTGLPTVKDEELFFPYGRFLFNLREYYDSQNTERRLYMPTASTIALNSSRYPYMEADPVLIERSVNNLLSNAFKYSYKYTNVYLDCFSKDQTYFIEVISYSSPIGEDVKGKIFELGNSQSRIRNYRKHKGKGIGLSVVNRVCKLHKGDLVLLSNDVISKYNIPVLHRLIRDLNSAEKNRKLAERLSELKISDAMYNEITAEYSRLQSLPPYSGQNYLSFMTWKQNAVEEICYDSSGYNDELRARSLHMSLRTPTARISFRMRIPQK